MKMRKVIADIAIARERGSEVGQSIKRKGREEEPDDFSSIFDIKNSTLQTPNFLKLSCKILRTRFVVAMFIPGIALDEDDDEEEETGGWGLERDGAEGAVFGFGA